MLHELLIPFIKSKLISLNIISENAEVQVDAEYALGDAIHIVCEYLSRKDLSNLAEACTLWRDVVMREKAKRFCVEQLRIPFKTNYRGEIAGPPNLFGTLNENPGVSVLIFNRYCVERLASRPDHEKKLLDECKRLQQKVILLRTDYCVSTKFQGNEHILGAFFASMDQRVHVRTVVIRFEKFSDQYKAVYNHLVEEFNLNDSKREKSTVLLFCNRFTPIAVTDSFKRKSRKDGKETIWAVKFPNLIEIVNFGDENNKENPLSRKDIVALRICGPNVMSWIVSFWNEFDYKKLKKFMETVKPRENSIGIMFSSDASVMVWLKSAFPKIPFLYIRSNEIMETAGRELHKTSVIIISYD